MSNTRKAQNTIGTFIVNAYPAVPGQEKPGRNQFIRNLCLAAICFGFFMVILDTTVVDVALPGLQRQFGASIAELQWVVDGYMLVYAGLLLTAGALGDRLGNKRIFLIGLVLFTCASALCGIAPDMSLLQFARVAQGLGAALQVPASLALLNHTFPDARERDRAIGIWGAVAGIAAGAGPVIGGLLINVLGWRSIFFLNVPLGLAGFLLTWRFVPTVPGLPQRGFDPGAQVAGIIALGLLTLASIQGNAWGWNSLPILGALAGFIVAALLFLLIERSSTNPILPLHFFASPTFSAATTIGLLLNFAFYAQLFLVSIFFQQIWGYSALITGLALLPEGGVIAISSALSGKVTARTGPRLPMVIGLCIGGFGFWLMMLINSNTAYLLLCPMLIAIGFGISFTMPAMTTAVVSSVPRERSGIASAVLNTSRQVGEVLGVALLGSLIDVHRAFMTGMHVALGIAGGAFLLGAVLSFCFVQRA
ncbi:DHA2 family efflux MFS transporter permease subunit [Ktedonosporobacter rubrisoli]|uniref:DHA2 family efflux MFS transporter permease subunit n=1 Tax=Ktedonosporobacter rubrisoli TaxID=2509675 RepID=A0A4P6JL64_KTERU|nr:MFS transporter [Ktedonosporobacter rubrisoli]QBD75732.1 DHA2 family efflux MFS transporter permease subunit [Ktedonosporobacter rubrisoli]